MPDESRFLRQIHSTWRDEQAVLAKIAFLPSAKDNGQLSGDDARLTTPEAAHARFTATPGRFSSGVFGLSEAECRSAVGEVVSSPTEDNPDHVHLDFGPLQTKGDKEKAAKKLRDHAVARGILFQPERAA